MRHEDEAPMVCHECENSARQWGYYSAENEDEEDYCPICGSSDVSPRPVVPPALHREGAA